MMHFGSRRASHAGYACRCRSHVVALSNVLRASSIVRVLIDEKAVIHRTYATASGRVETISYPNPIMQDLVQGGRTYPADCAATLQVVAGCLCRSCILADIAEAQGITSEGIEWMIESAMEAGSGSNHSDCPGVYDA